MISTKMISKNVQISHWDGLRRSNAASKLLDVYNLQFPLSLEFPCALQHHTFRRLLLLIGVVVIRRQPVQLQTVKYPARYCSSFVAFCCYSSFCYWHNSSMGQVLLIREVSRSHSTTYHSR